MKLVIVEDSELVRAQLLRLIAFQPRIGVVGTAGGEKAAVAAILAEKPDVVLLDLALSPGSGIRVLEQIRREGSRARVLVLTNSAGDALREACAAYGISGFYDKSHEVQACLAQMFGWLPAE
ncbi:MAG: response regulator transcription factor [Betaproteobacteria bacterium]|nr:response regulator transcription factor [Betaproteobacteria bacterium]